MLVRQARSIPDCRLAGRSRRPGEPDRAAPPRGRAPHYPARAASAGCRPPSMRVSGGTLARRSRPRRTAACAPCTSAAAASRSSASLRLWRCCRRSASSRSACARAAGAASGVPISLTLILTLYQHHFTEAGDIPGAQADARAEPEAGGCAGSCVPPALC